MRSHRLPMHFACLVAGLMVSSTSTFAQQQMAIGSHIEVDPTEMGNWQGGTLVSIDKTRRQYVVQLDAGYQVTIPFKEGTFGNKEYIRMPGANAGGAGGNAGDAGGNPGGNGNAGMNGGMNGNAPAIQNGLGGLINQVGGRLNGARAPQFGRQAADGSKPAMPAQIPADGALTEEIVKRLIHAEHPDYPGDVHSFQWGSIQIAPPRPSNNRDVFQAVPFGVQVYEVQATYTESEDTGMGQRPAKHDHRQTFSFWKDAMGNWTFQRKSVPGNYTSDVYH